MKAQVLYKASLGVEQSSLSQRQVETTLETYAKYQPTGLAPAAQLGQEESLRACFAC